MSPNVKPLRVSLRWTRKWLVYVVTYTVARLPIPARTKVAAIRWALRRAYVDVMVEGFGAVRRHYLSEMIVVRDGPRVEYTGLPERAEP